MAEAAVLTSDPRLADLITAVGEDYVLTDAAECAYYSQDLYRSGALAIAVVQPGTVEELQAVVKAATEAGLAVFPRGGGYSYTDAFLPTTSDGVVLDTGRLTQIVEINPQDMYVTVECGCTWETLDDALKPHGVRAEFWGPLSGFQATVGGGISQGSLSLGSARDGMSSEAVLGLDIVTADGEILSTGSAAQDGKSPFFRNYGPDLTGLFCCDAGALGIKARITLRLQRRARYTQGLSFGFETFNDFTTALKAVAATNRATEVFGFSTRAMEAAVASPGLWQDIKIMFSVGRAAGGLFAGLTQMIKMAVAGRRFASKAAFYAHCVVEGDNPLELKGHVRTLRDAIGNLGQDMPNTMPTVMRATPFMPYPVVGMDAKRMIPLHGILPFSKVAAFHADLEQLREDRSEEIEKLGITVPAMFATISTNAVLYEPVFYWPDRPTAFHERHSPDALIEPMRANTDNIEARQVVAELFSATVDLMHTHGGVHVQVGKVYPWTRDRAALNLDLVRTIKQKVDPKGLLNPGALGLS